MNYEVKMFNDVLKIYPTPFIALESLRDLMKAKIEADDGNILNYITQTTNEGDGLKMTATFSEERKKHFEDNTL